MSKRIVSVVLVLAILISYGISGLVIPTAAKSVNLIPNGDFEGFGEETPVYVPWAAYEASMNSTKATVKNGVGVDGSWGLELGSASGACYATFASAITLESGKTYRLSFMAKGATVDGDAALVQVYKANNVTYINNSSKSVYLRPGKTVNDWVSYCMEFTAGENASWDKSYSLLVNRGSDTGTIVFDNFVLEEVTADTNRVTSSDFEKASDRMFYESIKAGKMEVAVKATDTNANNKAMKLLATESGWDSAWMKSTHLTSGCSYKISFDYIGGGLGMYTNSSTHGAFNGNQDFARFAATDTWETAEVVYDFYTGGSNNWTFSFTKRSVDGHNTADTYIDNIRIEKLTPATGIELDKTTAELEVGNEITLKATFTPEGSSGEAIVWTSSDDGVATVVGGRVTAVKAGTATITATAGSLSAACDVTVKSSDVYGTDFSLADMAGHYKTQGRIYKTNTRLYLDWSAAGFAFNADCEGDVYVTFQIENIDETYGCYFTVIVDGVDQGRSACHLTENGTQKVKIASDLSAGEHRFEIYRQTPIGSITASINGVSLCGTLLDAPKNNNLYIEFIGDSITVAQGNLWESGMTSTSNPLVSNAMQGYAYMTAHDNLGADFSLVAVSGIGASVGWTSYTMQEVYPKLRYPKDKTTAYDFARQPDIVVLALGTNDLNRYSVNDMTLDDVKQGFKDMLEMVRENNPNAKVIWIHGMMLSSASSIIQEVVAEAGGTEAGIYELRLTQNNKGGNGHPDAAGHISFANDLTAFINNVVLTEATGIKLDKSTAELVTGETLTLNATFEPADAVTQDITWTSSDNSVAMVTNGKVVAVNAGVATITATAGSMSASCTITVKKGDNLFANGNLEGPDTTADWYTLSGTITDGVGRNGSKGLVKSAGSIYLKGQNFPLLSNRYYEFSFYVKGAVTTGDVWYNTGTASNNNQDIVPISETCVISTADEEGFKKYSCILAAGENPKLVANYAIAMSNFADGTILDDFSFVLLPELTSLVFNVSSLELQVGYSTNMTAVTEPAKAYAGSAAWKSSNTAVATVDSTGKITAVAEGIAIITASAGDVSSSCVVTVSPYANLIVNGDFDLGPGSEWGGNAAIVDGVDKSGNYAMTFSGSTQVEQYYKGKFFKGLEANTEYLLFIDHKTVGGGYPEIYINYGSAGNQANGAEMIDITKFSNSKGKWVTEVIPFKTGEITYSNTGWELALIRRVNGSLDNGSAEGTTYFDNLRVVKKNGAYVSNVVNGAVTLSNDTNSGLHLDSVAGSQITVTVTPNEGYILDPNSFSYVTADGVAGKILNKANGDFGEGDGTQFVFTVPAETTVAIVADFVSTEETSLSFGTLGTSLYYGENAESPNGVRFLNRLYLEELTVGNALTVRYNGQTRTITEFGSLIKRSENAAALTLDSVAANLNTAGAARMWKSVAYTADSDMMLVDYTESYLDFTVIMTKGDTLSQEEFEQRSYTVCGYVVLDDGTVLYTDAMTDSVSAALDRYTA